MGCLSRAYLKMSKDNTNVKIIYTKENLYKGRRMVMENCIRKREMQKPKEVPKLRTQISLVEIGKMTSLNTKCQQTCCGDDNQFYIIF